MCMLGKHSRFIRTITLVIPLFLIFMGMKVPDLSRPQKPKPMRRAVLDKTPVNKVLQSIVKVEYDPCITSQPVIAVFAPVEYFPEVRVDYSPKSLLTLRPFPPRAPPVSSPLANAMLSESNRS